MAKIVTGEQYFELDGQLSEIKRQLRQPSGYPFDPEMLKWHLQAAIEGRYALENFFRETGELVIQIPALPRPTLSNLQVKRSWIKSIERDISPTEPVTLVLATVLRESEGSINGAEYERRLTPKRDVLLGYQHRQWLLEHQAESPALMALLGKVYIDFPGLVVVGDNCRRFVPNTFQRGDRWGAYWHWLGLDLCQNSRVSSSRK
jgi:hypothetical protein